MTDTPKPTEIARQLRSIGVSDGYASDIANGKRTPSGKLAARIEHLLGIPAASWFSLPDDTRQSA